MKYNNIQKSNNNRLAILNKLKKHQNVFTPSPLLTNEIYSAPKQELGLVFAEEFKKIGGHFIYAQNINEAYHNIIALCKTKQWFKITCQHNNVIDNLKTFASHIQSCAIDDCDISITTCEVLIARLGSIIISNQCDNRVNSVYAPAHICIAYSHQLVYDIKDAMQYLKTKYDNKLPSYITCISGPSKTADIEKVLVTGIHGPENVYVILIDEEEK